MDELFSGCGAKPDAADTVRFISDVRTWFPSSGKSFCLSALYLHYLGFSSGGCGGVFFLSFSLSLGFTKSWPH